MMFDVFFDAQELRRHVKAVENCKRLGTERNHDAQNKEWIQKEREDSWRGSRCECYPLQKERSDFSAGEMLSTASDSFFRSTNLSAGMAHPILVK